jgi:hypothetical protein
MIAWICSRYGKNEKYLKITAGKPEGKRNLDEHRHRRDTMKNMFNEHDVWV